jgi:ribosomal RNA-processing protein 12
MFQRVLAHGEAPKTTEVKVFETVVQQVWSTFPGYCDLPLDLQTAFDRQFAELLANLLYQQVDLRQDILRGLRALIESNQAIVAAGMDEEEDLVLQHRVTRLAAAANLEYLGKFAGNFLAVLFNVYGQTLTQSRAALLETIDLFLSITPKSEVTATYDRVLAMISESMQDGSAPVEDRPHEKAGESGTSNGEQTLFDLVISMAVYLPRERFASLYALATQALTRTDQPQLQKKMYKLIPRLSVSLEGQMALKDRIAELQDLLLTSADKVSVTARRDRLNAIAAIVPLLPTSDLHFIPSVVSEVVVCCKEHNERTRETAFDLLVAMGQKLGSSAGALISNARVLHMAPDSASVPANIEEYLTMISAGLAGSTPHMISASISALSRVVYEFHQSVNKLALCDLLDTMDLFLTSNNREIVRAAIGFVKVAFVSLPLDLMAPRLASAIPKLLVWSHEHKGHLRAKVKHIFERMLRRFGFEVVAKYCPDADRKLLVNIRKAKDRSKRKGRTGTDSEGESEGDRAEKANRFENEFDAALHSSDEDDEQMGEPDATPSRRKTAGRTRNAFIVEDEEEPLDLLGRGALAKVSRTKPSRQKVAQLPRARLNGDGKLVLGEDTDFDSPTAMDMDTRIGITTGDENGVGAYVSAIKNGDVARRGQRGKLKFSNRRRAADDEDEAAEDGRPRTTRANDGRPLRLEKLIRGASVQRAGRGTMVPARRGLGQHNKRRDPSGRGRVIKRGFTHRRSR